MEQRSINIKMWTIVIENGKVYNYSSNFKYEKKDSKPVRKETMGTLQKARKSKVCK